MGRPSTNFELTDTMKSSIKTNHSPTRDTNSELTALANKCQDKTDNGSNVNMEQLPEQKETNNTNTVKIKFVRYEL